MRSHTIQHFTDGEDRSKILRGTLGWMKFVSIKRGLNFHNVAYQPRCYSKPRTKINTILWGVIGQWIAANRVSNVINCEDWFHVACGQVPDDIYSSMHRLHTGIGNSMNTSCTKVLSYTVCGLCVQVSLHILLSVTTWFFVWPWKEILKKNNPTLIAESQNIAAVAVDICSIRTR